MEQRWLPQGPWEQPLCPGDQQHQPKDGPAAGLMSQNSEESLPPIDIGSAYLRITLPISSDPHGVEKQIKLATRLLSRKQERFASQQEHPNTQENCFTAPC